MSKKILIVDDEIKFVGMVKTRLENSGYEVDVAFDGKEGIQKVKSFRPDLVLMDILMPELSGGDAVRILKDDSSTKFIPIIFFTALVNSKEDHKMLKIGDTFYPTIAKPFKPEYFLKRIQDVLGE